MSISRLIPGGGSAWLPANMAGSQAGQAAILCCPGPSLANVAGELRGPGRIVCAINTAYPRVKPDLWCGMDAPACYDSRLALEPFPKFYGNKFAGEVEAANAIFVSGGDGDLRPWQIFEPAQLAADPGVFWPTMAPNTLFTAVHILAWLGVSKIYLVGCDLGGKSDYHDGRVLADGRRARNAALYNSILQDLPMLRLGAEESGREIVSCTPDSPANKYLRFLPLADAIAEIEAGLPAAGRPVLDAADAEALRPRADAVGQGVITGADAGNRWLLPWWFSNLRRHYAGPVAVFDFGLDTEGRRFCERAGIYRAFKREVPGWFNKPLALIASPFKRSAWLDLDCEVRGPIEELFSEPSLLAAAADPVADWGPCNTGVVVANNNDPLLIEWGRACLTRHASTPRGDQPLLNELLTSGNHLRLRAQMNWCRMAGEAPADAAIIHHTGPAGKLAIKRMIGPGHRGEVLLGLLQQHGMEAGTGAEIGVFQGSLSRFLLGNCPDLRLLLVDRWDMPTTASYAASGDDLASWTQDDMRAARLKASAAVAFAGDRADVRHGDSLAVARTVADESLDFVFIDADHSREGVLADLSAWAIKVRPGGIIAGHDIDHPDYPAWGVRQAVEEFIAIRGCEELHTGQDYTWWFVHAGEPAAVPA